MNVGYILIAITLFIVNKYLFLAMLAFVMALIVPVEGYALVCFLVPLTASIAV